MSRIAMTIGAALFALTGCSTTQPRSVPSRLSGVWEAVDDARDTLVIQPDGTFDFTRTMWAMAGDVSKLRKAGDRLERPQDGVRFEVTASEITPTTSYIRVKATRRLPEGGEAIGYELYHAHLEPDGRLAVRAGTPDSQDARPESLAVRQYRRVGDAPPVRKPPPAPKETKDEWITLGRRQFAGENWFEKLRVKRLSSGALNSVLLMPRDQERAERFLVVRVKPTDKVFYEGDLAGCGADAAKVGCSILHIAIPELDRYGRPDAARVAELAEQVRSRTREAIDLLQPVKCGLETYDNATYVGHYLWQKDNSLYDGWFCWQPTYSYWYGASADASRDKPALLLVYPFPNDREVREHETVVAEYREHGFDNTRLTEIQMLVPNWQQQSIRLLAEAVGAGDLN